MIGTIYSIVNNINNKIYIGQTTQKVEERWKQHCYSTHSYIGRAIHKNGKENFLFNIIQEVEYEDGFDIIKKLNELEIYYINKFDSYNSGYNLTIGGSKGTIGYRHTEENKEIMSKKHTDYYNSLTEEKKIEVTKGMHNTPVWNKGVENCFSDETLEKMSKATKSYCDSLSVEEKKQRVKNMHNAPVWNKNKTNIYSEATKKSMGRSGKENIHSISIRCVETDIIYESVRQASIETNISQGSLHRALKKETFTAGKLHWIKEVATI